MAGVHGSIRPAGDTPAGPRGRPQTHPPSGRSRSGATSARFLNAAQFLGAPLHRMQPPSPSRRGRCVSRSIACTRCDVSSLVSRTPCIGRNPRSTRRAALKGPATVVASDASSWISRRLSATDDHRRDGNARAPCGCRSGSRSGCNGRRPGGSPRCPSRPWPGRSGHRARSRDVTCPIQSDRAWPDGVGIDRTGVRAARGCRPGSVSPRVSGRGAIARCCPRRTDRPLQSRTAPFTPGPDRGSLSGSRRSSRVGHRGRGARLAARRRGGDSAAGPAGARAATRAQAARWGRLESFAGASRLPLQPRLRAREP